MPGHVRGRHSENNSARNRTGTVRMFDGDAYWRNLANTTEPSVCDGDAALCQITLTTCYIAFTVACIIAFLCVPFLRATVIAILQVLTALLSILLYTLMFIHVTF